MDNFIKLENITLEENNKVIVDELNLSFEKGKLCLLVGPQGAGKRAILKCIGGINIPIRGNVLIGGKDLYNSEYESSKGLRSKLSYVFPNGGLLANLTILENLLLPFNYHFPELSKEKKIESIKNYFEEFEILVPLDARPSDISASHKKIIGFVRALLTDPEILLLDEPLSHAEIFSRVHILHKILSMKNENITQIMINQSSRDFLKVADFIIAIEDGKVTETGKFRDFMHLQVEEFDEAKKAYLNGEKS